uniref:CSN12-like protein n=1 Tax=Panagrellus redivivus TaxID=6233 RepID=A0A7E4ZYF3_PANRE
MNSFGKSFNTNGTKKAGASSTLFGRALPAQGSGSIFGGAAWPPPSNEGHSPESAETAETTDGSAESSRDASSDDIPTELLNVPPATVNDLTDYVNLVFKYLAFRDWTATVLAAPLLSLDNEHARCSFLQVENPTIAAGPDASAEDALLYELIGGHISVIHYASVQDWVSAFAMQSAIVTVYRQEIVAKEKNSNWFIPLAYVICDDLWKLAKKIQATHNQLDEEDSGHEYLDKVVTHTMGLYQTCTRDSRIELDQSKKVGIFQLTVLLLQIYFETNKMALLKPLLRAVHILPFVFRERLSTSDLVLYSFYLGKKNMFDSDLQMSDKALEYAFKYCPERYFDNKRRILIYWIPVKMFLGEIPLDNLLDDYGLSEFKMIANGVREGNIRQLREGIVRNRQFLMQSGVYLMVEKLAQLTYFALFKRLVGILGTHKIKLEAFQCLLTFLGEDIRHIDEVVCIISNLIAKKKIRGYISKMHNVVVLSKENPFD